MFRMLICVLVIICFTTQSKSQNIDSLERVLNKFDMDSVKRVELLNYLSREYIFINSKKSFDFANQALILSQQMGYKTGIAYAYRNLSGIYSLNEIYFQAMDYLQFAKDIFSSLGDSVGVANSYISMAYLYRKLNLSKQEILYNKKAYDEFLKLKIPERIGVAAHNLSESYLSIGEIDSAKLLVHYAIKINDSIKNLSVLSSCYKVLGIIEFNHGNLNIAKTNFYKTLELSDQLGKYAQKTATVDSYMYLAKIYKENNDLDKYEQFMRKAVIYSKENLLSNFLPEIYIDLLVYYSERKQIAKVQDIVTEYKNVLDSMNVISLKDKSDLVQRLGDVYTLEKENRYLSADKLQQIESIRFRNLVIIISSFFLLSLVSLVVLLGKANRNIKHKNQILEQKNRTIDEQNYELLTLNESKDKFFTIVAHDLRSPLASLKSFSDLLNSQIEDLSKDEIAFMNNHLYSSVDNTLKLIDNLIKWAKLQMKQYEFNPVRIHLSELFMEINSLYKSIANDKNIELNVLIPEDIFIFGDRNQVNLIFRNLLNNAIKYTNSGGTVQVKATKDSNDVVIVSFSDNGTGISDVVKSRLFKPSETKSEPGTHGELGSGMGLMLVYEFVKLNKGTISVESAEGEGSIFTISFLTSS